MSDPVLLSNTLVYPLKCVRKSQSQNVHLHFRANIRISEQFSKYRYLKKRKIDRKNVKTTHFEG